MAIGPGKHDRYCTQIRQETGAAGVIVIVLGAPGQPEVSGFSAQVDLEAQLRLPAMLENLADEIRASHANGSL